MSPQWLASWGEATNISLIAVLGRESAIVVSVRQTSSDVSAWAIKTSPPRASASDKAPIPYLVFTTHPQTSTFIYPHYDLLTTTPHMAQAVYADHPLEEYLKRSSLSSSPLRDLSSCSRAMTTQNRGNGRISYLAADRTLYRQTMKLRSSKRMRWQRLRYYHPFCKKLSRCEWSAIHPPGMLVDI
jgi:hypothetical protein